ncbi:MAG: hypothetical protein WC529_08805 [Candidatus Margulisiibacteriota bacterium]
MKKSLLAGLLVLIAASSVFAMGGTVPPREELTAEEILYLDNVMAAPLEMTIPAKDIKNAWDRAQGFVGRYSNMKIQVSTDYAIQTYTPEKFSGDYGYYVNKMKTEAGEYTISVQCIGTGAFSNKDQLANQQILAYYIKTGKVMPKFITH